MNTRHVSIAPGRSVAGVHRLPTPLVLDGSVTWKPHHLFTVRTRGLHQWSAHVSALAPGTMPHPPHVHDQEEILLLLAGEVDIVVPEAAAAGSDGRRRLRPGSFAYYPSGFAHTLEAMGEETANYLMFRWLNVRAESGSSTLPFGVFDAPTRAAAPPGRASVGLAASLVFDSPTSFLRRFHCHLSMLPPGSGYEPHADRYDVALVLLEGEIETLGQRVEPWAVVACPAGVAHGMWNPGETSARYLAFEFDGSTTSPWARARYQARRLPRRGLGKIRRALRARRPGR